MKNSLIEDHSVIRVIASGFSGMAGILLSKKSGQNEKGKDAGKLKRSRDYWQLAKLESYRDYLIRCLVLKVDCSFMGENTKITRVNTPYAFS